jgi:hypothetical protein
MVFGRNPHWKMGPLGHHYIKSKMLFFFNIFFMVKLFEIGIGSYGKIEMDTLALSKTCGCFQGK